MIRIWEEISGTRVYALHRFVVSNVYTPGSGLTRTPTYVSKGECLEDQQRILIAAPFKFQRLFIASETILTDYPLLPVFCSSRITARWLEFLELM